MRLTIQSDNPEWIWYHVSIVGVNTFRVTQEYKDSYMLDDGELLQVFKKCKDLGAYVTTLAENGHIVDKVSLSDFH